MGERTPPGRIGDPCEAFVGPPEDRLASRCGEPSAGLDEGYPLCPFHLQLFAASGRKPVLRITRKGRDN